MSRYRLFSHNCLQTPTEQQVVVRDLVAEMRCTYNHHLNTVHITYYILFPRHDKTVKEFVDLSDLF